MPDRSRSCGLLIAPALRITSRRVGRLEGAFVAVLDAPTVGAFEIRRRLSARVSTVRFGRDSTGRRKALVTLKRTPSLMVMLK